jgi:hypothetical protein
MTSLNVNDLLDLDQLLLLGTAEPDREKDSSSQPQPPSRCRSNKKKRPEFSLKKWLEGLDLAEYHSKLKKEGYDKPLALRELTEKELDELGITKKGHRKILLNAVKDPFFSSRSLPTSVSTPILQQQVTEQSPPSPDSPVNVTTPQGAAPHPNAATCKPTSDSDLSIKQQSINSPPLTTASTVNIKEEQDDSLPSSKTLPTVTPATQRQESISHPSVQQAPHPQISPSPSTLTSSSATQSPSAIDTTQINHTQDASNLPTLSNSTTQTQTAQSQAQQRVSTVELVPHHSYQRSWLHNCLGGQRYGGISTPSAFPFILLFASDDARSTGYVNKHEDGVWWFCGQGQGDMVVDKGANRSLLRAKESNKRLLFFTTTGSGMVTFEGEVEYVRHEERSIPNVDGVERKSIVFCLRSVDKGQPRAVVINLIDTKYENVSVESLQLELKKTRKRKKRDTANHNQCDGVEQTGNSNNNSKRRGKGKEREKDNEIVEPKSPRQVREIVKVVGDKLVFAADIPVLPATSIPPTTTTTSTTEPAPIVSKYFKGEESTSQWKPLKMGLNKKKNFVGYGYHNPLVYHPYKRYHKY